MYDIRACPNGVYAVGMGRRVYRRTGSAQWTRVDRDMRPRSDDEVDAGFRSIHGLPDGSLYAVGFDGEIWSFDRQRWTREDSPTNMRPLIELYA